LNAKTTIKIENITTGKLSTAPKEKSLIKNKKRQIKSFEKIFYETTGFLVAYKIFLNNLVIKLVSFCEKQMRK